MNRIGPAFVSDYEGEDVINWSMMFPGYFETTSRGRIIATDTTVLVCDKWLNADDEERKALFYGAGLFHLCRVAAFEIPGETGENTLREIDKMEDWPAEPLVAKAKSAIKAAREQFVASGVDEVSKYKESVSAVCRFKGREERRWNWTRLIRAMRPLRGLSQPPEPPSIYWPDFRSSIAAKADANGRV